MTAPRPMTAELAVDDLIVKAWHDGQREWGRQNPMLTDPRWSHSVQSDRDAFAANHILTALREAGFVVVPIEPTEAMSHAAEHGPLAPYLGNERDYAVSRETWAAMLAAV